MSRRIAAIQPELILGAKPIAITDKIVEPPIGSVVKVSGKFANSTGEFAKIRYDYAAIRAGNGYWFTTGSTCPVAGYSWEEFLFFLAQFVEPKGERLS